MAFNAAADDELESSSSPTGFLSDVGGSELFLLIETAAGVCLAYVKQWDEIALDLPDVQQKLTNHKNFSQYISLRAVYPFQNAEEALDTCNCLAAGESNELLRSFLDQNLPRRKKKFQLGVIDPSLAKHLASLNYPVKFDKNIIELTRLCRMHLKKLAGQFGGETDIGRFQVGLGHSFSRSKIQFDPNRQDKPVQNAIALIENLDKSINTFSMRIREWYAWHFPELSKIITDHVKFAQAAKLMRVKEDFDESRKPELVELVDGDESIAEQVMAAKDCSMGQQIVEVDMINIDRFCDQVIRLSEQRRRLGDYLDSKLAVVAPNLQTLVGDVLAAKLIAHSGSLTNLSKYPASTVQILGAEKALFRALKTKGNTPKYGLLFQSSFIGRAAQKNKGRISRYLANKCSLAARIDNFAVTPCNVFGEKMKNQVEARLEHLVSGITTKRNIDVMKDALVEYDAKVAEIVKKRRRAEKKKKKAATIESVAEPVNELKEVEGTMPDETMNENIDNKDDDNRREHQKQNTKKQKKQKQIESTASTAAAAAKETKEGEEPKLQHRRKRKAETSIDDEHVLLKKTKKQRIKSTTS